MPSCCKVSKQVAAINSQKPGNKSMIDSGPLQADTWKAIAHIPWMIKPLYGFLTDTIPIMGRRRRPYLVICGVSGLLHALLLRCWASIRTDGLLCKSLLHTITLHSPLACCTMSVISDHLLQGGNQIKLYALHPCSKQSFERASSTQS